MSEALSLKIPARSIRDLLDAARGLRKLARLDEAEALYESVLQRHANHPRALVGLGRIARARGNLRRALTYFEAALSAEPGITSVQLRIASCLRNLARVNEARRIYRSILTDTPGHSVALLRLRKLRAPEGSGLPPMERSWLRRATFARAAEWSGNLEALSIPAFSLNLLTLVQDFAAGASEEVKRDCILVRRGETTKILPLVSDWVAYETIVRREAALLPPGSLLGQVPQDGWTHDFELIECHREFVYRRESAAAMPGSSLSSTRKQVRQLLKAGARTEPIGPANLDRVIACNARWFAGKHQRGRKTYYRGRTLWTFENLPLLAELGVRHLAVVLDGDVIGYTVGTHLTPSCAVFTFRRGDREPAGVSAYMLSELAKLYPEYEWINDGPAVNKPGLAEFKEKFTINAGERQVTLGWIRAPSRP